MDTLPESINYHITERCNYGCKFCFARYHNHNKELTLESSLKLVNLLVENGCKKINFAGGEPTLIRYLPDLINYSKDLGLFVSIISNGSGISKEFLTKCGKSLDIVGLSIDSSSDIIETELGRSPKIKYGQNKGYSHVDLIKNRVKLVKSYDIKLKINSTITPLNWNDDMSDLLLLFRPYRWKVLEINPIGGVNDNFFKVYGKLESWQFQWFIKRNLNFNPIWESNNLITDSYCMITPDGCFYQNTNNRHNYSEQILNRGVLNAFYQVKFSYIKYRLRFGDYFKVNKTIQ